MQVLHVHNTKEQVCKITFDGEEQVVRVYFIDQGSGRFGNPIVFYNVLVMGRIKGERSVLELAHTTNFKGLIFRPGDILSMPM